MSPVDMFRLTCRAFLVLATATTAIAQETTSFTGYVMTPFMKPVAGATVTAIDCNRLDGEENLRNRNIFQTETDAQGRFHFDALPLHEERTPGGFRAFTIVAQLDELVKAAYISVEYENFSQPMHITLQEGGYLEGVVLDAEADPISEAWVWPYESYIGPDDPYPMFDVLGAGAGKALAVQTDEEGRFRLGPLPYTARKWAVRAAHPEYAPGGAASFEPDQSDIEVSLSRGSTLRGRAVNAVDGSPLPNVFVRHPRIGSTVSAGAYTNADGTFTLVGVPQGMHAFPRTFVKDKRFTRVDMKPIDVDGVSDYDGYEMRFTPSASITGRVVDVATGAGVAETYVIAVGMEGQDQRPMSTRTDEDGRYELMAVPVGNVAVFVRAHFGFLRTNPEAAKLWEERGFGSHYMKPVGDFESIEIAQGKSHSGIDLQLDSVTAVRGRVNDENGSPVVDAEVFGWPPLRQDSDHPGRESLSVKSSTDGSFELRGLSATKDVYIVARAPGYLGDRVGPLSLSDSVPDLALSLTPGGQITGTVIFDGRPLGGAYVECKLEDYKPPLEVRVFTNPEGEFSIDGLPQGVYDVRDYWSGDSFREIALSREAPTAELHFQGKNNLRRFRGIVTLDGKPFVFGDIDLSYDKYRGIETTTNAAGEFIVPFYSHNFSITAHVSVGRPYKAKLSQKVTAEPGEEVSARFDFVTPIESP